MKYTRAYDNYCAMQKKAGVSDLVEKGRNAVLGIETPGTLGRVLGRGRVEEAL